MKNVLNELIIGLYKAGKRISEPENQPINITQTQRQQDNEKKSRMKKAEHQHS